MVADEYEEFKFMIKESIKAIMFKYVQELKIIKKI